MNSSPTGGIWVTSNIYSQYCIDIYVGGALPRSIFTELTFWDLGYPFAILLG